MSRLIVPMSRDEWDKLSWWQKYGLFLIGWLFVAVSVVGIVTYFWSK